MSNSLYYEVVRPSRERALPDNLKYILAKRYELVSGRQRLNSGDLNYLSGLMDGGIEGVDKLIAAIEKYGQVDIFLGA